MKTYELTGSVRTELGKKATKACRAAQNVPCVLYGGAENLNFTAKFSDLRKLIYTPEVYVVDLTIGTKKTQAVVKELQFHPVNDSVMHIDFLEVSAAKPVMVEVPVKLTGLAEGVKAGGKLSLEMRKMKVKGIYTEIPENIVIDVTALGLGKKIQVADVQVEKLQLMNAKNAIVAQVKMTRASRDADAAK